MEYIPTTTPERRRRRRSTRGISTRVEAMRKTMQRQSGMFLLLLVAVNALVTPTSRTRTATTTTRRGHVLFPCQNNVNHQYYGSSTLSTTTKEATRATTRTRTQLWTATTDTSEDNCDIDSVVSSSSSSWGLALDEETAGKDSPQSTPSSSVSHCLRTTTTMTFE